MSGDDNSEKSVVDVTPVAAMTGNFDPRGLNNGQHSLDEYRDYLLAIARADLPEHLQSKVGASDLVQETLLKAVENYSQFQGSTREELARWLRTILVNLIANWQKAYHSQKRDIALEVTIDVQLQGACQESPSAAAVSVEQRCLLDDAMKQLSDEYRKAILFRHRDNLQFPEIGRLLGKTEEAARKIWTRAIRQLQRELQRHDSKRDQ